jgi:DNA/RNA-binding domain of Phe-tRNA-synthetase-like protein
MNRHQLPNRRSAETIAQELDKIVGLLKKNPDGMRSEHIREALGMIAKEMPRLLAEGLKTKKLKAKGLELSYWQQGENGGWQKKV